jgi:hypothetical protein
VAVNTISASCDEVDNRTNTLNQKTDKKNGYPNISNEKFFNLNRPDQTEGTTTCLMDFAPLGDKRGACADKKGP